MIYSIFLVVLLVAVCSAQEDATDLFDPLPNVNQDFTEIQLGVTCPSDVVFSGKVNAIHFIVEPVQTDTVVVKTRPPNLVDLSTENGVLRFHYNQVSLTLHENGGGVLVQVPEGQLGSIRGAPGTTFRAWVLNGFTALQTIVQEAKDAFLIVDVDSTVGRMTLNHGGEGNSLFLGHDVEVDIDISGKSHSVTFKAVIKSGTMSATKSLLWTNGDIDQLTVSGAQNRVFVFDNMQCRNVNRLVEPNSCEILATTIDPPAVTPLSTVEVFVTCPQEVESPTTSSPTPSAGWKITRMPNLYLISATITWIFSNAFF